MHRPEKKSSLPDENKGLVVRRRYINEFRLARRPSVRSHISNIDGGIHTKSIVDRYVMCDLVWTSVSFPRFEFPSRPSQRGCSRDIVIFRPNLRKTSVTVTVHLTEDPIFYIFSTRVIYYCCENE